MTTDDKPVKTFTFRDVTFTIGLQTMDPWPSGFAIEQSLLPCGNVTPEHIVEHALTRGGLYRDRHGGHRYMGEPALYPCCGGCGWYAAEDGERYCKGTDGTGCRAGDEKRRVD